MQVTTFVIRLGETRSFCSRRNSEKRGRAGVPRIIKVMDVSKQRRWITRGWHCYAWNTVWRNRGLISCFTFRGSKPGKPRWICNRPAMYLHDYNRRAERKRIYIYIFQVRDSRRFKSQNNETDSPPFQTSRKILPASPAIARTRLRGY